MKTINRSKAISRRRSFFAGGLLMMALIAASGCGGGGKPAKTPVMFELLESDRTGLTFSNTLTPSDAFNVFKYMYYFNGGGVGAGDFNNDGKIDLFFAGNEVGNRLYLNQGGMKFRDVSQAAGIVRDSAWSTGVSIVDINNDGLLDIYVCRVGHLEILNSHNELLVCQGIGPDGVPRYRDEAAKYGLDFSGFSTQAAFLDYDGDGDLDMYLLNHSIHQNGTFGVRQDRLNTANPLSGDRLFRNDNGHFTDVTKAAGIHSSVIGFGLGIITADINLDGYPDLYIGNDFHENDYLYLNQHNGSFVDSLTSEMMHTSQYSMGVDVADANNDGFPDIITMDMLPSDPYILKRSEGEDDNETFRTKIRYGYSYQYTRNNLQYNRRNGVFSEIGLYAGVYATDWSWSPLFMDFDNDGRKDLFISNGIPKRLNDIDYINFISNLDIQDRLKDDGLGKKDLSQLDRFPQIKIPDRFFLNSDSLQFRDVTDHVSNQKNTYSNGAVYADLDNDGDLDIVVNNIDDPAMLYENRSNEISRQPYADVRLTGPTMNRNALGAKIIAYAGSEVRLYEKFPVRGFMSSMEIPLHIGLGGRKIDSAVLIWPDNSFEALSLRAGDSALAKVYRPGLPRFDYSVLRARYANPTMPVSDITARTGLAYLHRENPFPEFEREPLIPHMLSSEGPALVVADINKDGRDDVFVGASRYGRPAVFIQGPDGRFAQKPEAAFASDTSMENVSACAVDVNLDGAPDLVIANGGNEFFGNDIHLQPQLFLNDGQGNFTRVPHVFDNIFINASVVTTTDFDADGKPDLFIGGRSVPFAYGEIPPSVLLKGDGRGGFINVTAKAPGLDSVGFVTNAVWTDLDKDGRQDLLLSLEWGGLVAYMNHGDRFEQSTLSDRKGWWNFLLPVDLNGDGKEDLVAGNLGLNSRLKASPEEPVRLYYGDFDGNGKKDQVLSYYLDGREIPFANKEELQKQMPVLKKKFLYAEDFARAKFNDLFPVADLQKARTFQADDFANSVLLSAAGKFELRGMPWEAQLSTYRDAAVIDANNDGRPDVLLVGNYYDNNIQMGRYDADYGTLLMNDGEGKFHIEMLNGLAIKGQVRHIRSLTIAGQSCFVLARNNDSLQVIRFGDRR